MFGKNSTASKQNLGCVSPKLQIFANIYYKCCKLGLELVYGHFHWCCYSTAPVIYTYHKFVGVIDHATTITSKARERGNSTAHLFSKKKNSIWKWNHYQLLITDIYTYVININNVKCSCN